MMLLFRLWYTVRMNILPTIAIMYDFDKTLTTKDMQEYTFIPKLGMEAAEFWAKTNVYAEQEGMDSILAYMKLMLDESRNRGQEIHRSDLVGLGSSLQFFPGVVDWFETINEVGLSLGLKIDHYIISSGLKEIIEGSPVGKYFKRIYACEYFYDERGIAVWPKLAVNYTAKTQFLFRINKGVLAVNEDRQLNAYTPLAERAVPFGNMVYIGDGLTDVPCMKLVKTNGGHSIAVYQEHTIGIAHRLMKEDRINYQAKADYTKEGYLFKLVCTILEKLKSENWLLQEHRRMLQTAEEDQ